MKKQATIFFISICLITSLCFSQDSSHAKNKKQKYCSVRLVRTDGTNEKFILGGFSEDNIWGYSFANGDNKKQIQPGQPVVVSSADIKKVFIRIENRVLIPGNTKTSDSVDIKRFNSKLRIDGLSGIEGPGSGPGTDLFYIPELYAAVLAIELLFPPKGRWYHVKGNERRFNKMTRDFASKKEK